MPFLPKGITFFRARSSDWKRILFSLNQFSYSLVNASKGLLFIIEFLHNQIVEILPS